MSFDTGIFIALLALLVSCVSMGVSLYNVVRDRARIKAYSSIYYDHSRSLEPDPSLRIRVVNVGRRPVMLAYLVKSSREGEWASTLRPIQPPEESGGQLGVWIDKAMLAQHSALRLAEGEVFEMLIHREDYGFHLCNCSGDSVLEAEKLYVEDVQGRRYFVKGSRKNIARLIS
ncbi:hypothetical protein [Phytopseudomonas daroniae]|uniref:hypothetical protein n=1 Tax=Phytopseudomonas daroniae TaxID=2487519 RepID=UPI00103838F2|nr:hypothetical protein [Pseudomonas daroniae]TBU76191.1 hypothetical protein DNK10_09465 [Pseudomonas daroniae]